MSKSKWQECKRCGGPFIETNEQAERRRFLDAAIICPVCEEEFEQIKKDKKLGKLYYIGNTEPVMW